VRIIDYDIVTARMKAGGLVSLYHNSGAWGFAPGMDVKSVGWIEADDPTIRPAARALARRVPSIVELLPRVLEHIGGEVWLSPKSHWHYELHFGNRELLQSLLPRQLDDLRERNDGSAIAFSPEEREQLAGTIERLLNGLRGSDFLLVFVDSPTLATIHHHKQLWWQTADHSVHPLLIG
jgi:hypothetical protein